MLCESPFGFRALYFTFATMLTELRVKNYALIKDIVFRPGKSFNVITGETGAGKSILLGALGLVLGKRSDSISVKQNEEKCIIEALFDISGYNLNAWFGQNEFDYSDELIIRREILISGKTRAFVNDTPAQLSHIKELGRFLIDVHSQHDNLDLFQKSFQFKVLDSYSETEALQNLFTANFEHLKRLKNQLTELKDIEKNGLAEREYKQFLFDELSNANLSEGELSMLEEEQLTLSFTDQNLQTLGQISNTLIESEASVLDQFALLKNQLLQITKNDKRFESISNRFGELNIELKEIGNELTHFAQNIFLDPQRLESINTRLALLHALSKKHRVENLIQMRDDLEAEILGYANVDGQIELLEQDIVENNLKCMAMAQQISTKRMEHCNFLETEINKRIEPLGMPGATLKIDVIELPDSKLGTYGMNDANFLFSPAPGKAYNPIQNIASGGEISRVMLVLKAILAHKNIMPTLIFDEIDTGVSGDVAFKIGDTLEAMSNNMQLICITHLPQIAAKGKSHYFVYKNNVAGNTTSDIKKLNESDRINEIAEMIGGKAFGKTIRESAIQLLSN